MSTIESPCTFGIATLSPYCREHLRTECQPKTNRLTTRPHQLCAAPKGSIYTPHWNTAHVLRTRVFKQWKYTASLGLLGLAFQRRVSGSIGSIAACAKCNRRRGVPMQGFPIMQPMSPACHPRGLYVWGQRSYSTC